VSRDPTRSAVNCRFQAEALIEFIELSGGSASGTENLREPDFRVQYAARKP